MSGYPGFFAVPGSMWPGSVWPGDAPPPLAVLPAVVFAYGIPCFAWATGGPYLS